VTLWADVALLRPWWLAALPLIAALHFWRRRRVAGLGGWRRAVDPALLAAMAATGRVAPGAARALAPAAALAALLALALSGPARQTRDAQAWRNLDGMTLALDLSPSVAEGPGLRALLDAAQVLLARAGSRGASAIVFAGDAYAVAPFTTDHATLGRTLAALDEGSVPDPGSDPARALRLAGARLAAAGIVAGDVALIGDGGGIGPDALAAAAEIRRAGGRVHALLVAGSPDAPAGAPADAPADADALRRLAAAGGGRFADAAQAATLARALGAPAPQRLRDSGLGALMWRDGGFALLWLAAIPALMLFRRAR